MQVMVDFFAAVGFASSFISYEITANVDSNEFNLPFVFIVGPANDGL